MAKENEKKVPIEEGAEEEPVKLSRRDFLIGAGTGAVVVGAAAGGYTALRTPEQVEVVGPAAPAPQEAGPVAAPSTTGLPASMRTVSLNIDGKPYEAVVDVRESLWETMTYKLGLGSRTSLGCDRAQCGACGVVVDGRSVNGCTLLSARLGRGQEILTVYGLTTGNGPEDLHPIQQAYLENLGLQCAICSRGFIMSTYALLSKNLNPTEDEVRKALEGNICRCGNYTKIFDSVAAAAETMRAAG
jgi:aerobic-type carbon monoxide dehydrogenase small subunit (CoxS/CutS family)